MIPHELRFHGIRDYEPTSIDLSGAGEHILIAGPNGSGKSTITFCMGAVLYSSKVDVEGLKSRNIQEDKTWRASIHFLFKNEGPTRIDAPLYIQFSVDFEQEPSSPIKRIYKIADGDEINELTNKATFRSGGQPNFGDYRRELTDKYKIYPDYYYLIWYQQEVNQFAVMSPEERFRVFSEMHGISNIQKNWEVSLEQVKEIKSSVVEAEVSVNNDKLRMLDAEKMYERLKAHQESIRINGRDVIQSLRALTVLYKQRLNTTEGIIEDLLIQRDDLTESLHLVDKEVANKRGSLQTITEEKEHYIEEINRKAEELEQKKEEAGSLKESIKLLENQLKEVEEKSKRLRYTEKETKEYYKNREQLLKDQTNQLNNYKDKIKNLQDENIEIIDKRAKLQNDIDVFKEKEKGHQELLEQYKSKHIVEERISFLDETISNHHKRIDQLKEYMKETRDELSALENNQVVSKRQQEVLNEMKQADVRAYPLQSLIELQDNAPVEAEHQLDAIKYTIFYDAKYVLPINDLYHVSLMKIIPEYYIDAIPELQLQMKKGLNKEEKTFAAKALWWVKQFLSEEYPMIRDGKLIDSQGIRGKQEYRTYILSEKAIQARKAKLKKEILEKSNQLNEWKEKNDMAIKELQQLHSVVGKVAEAEAFQLQIHQHQRNETKLWQYNSRLEEIKQEKEKLEQMVDEIKGKIARIEVDLEHLEHDLEVYEQLGVQKSQFEELYESKKYHKKLQNSIQQLQEKTDQLEERFRKKEDEEEKRQRQISQGERRIEDMIREKNSMEIQMTRKKEEKEVLQSNIIKNEEELLEMKEFVPKLYKETLTLEPLKKQTESTLKNNYLHARREFDFTRQETGINPEAGNIYHKAKENYDEKSAEFNQLKRLLEENQKRAEENEQNLVTTIQMKVLRIHQLFQNYMTHFQFECDINFDKYEEKNGRVNFRLFIKVRKQGHRGRMEDVSLKARAGKVGKGVSGGEESLSSLLFALALLQELDINPSFIVLDEFDSALDEGRKAKVFDLYAKMLDRKLIIISPKGHENEYLNHFQKAYIARHDPTQLKSVLAGVRK